MDAYGNSISFEDWLAEFPEDFQQEVQEGGKALIDQCNAASKRVAKARQLHEECESATTHLVVLSHKLGTYLKVCRDELEPEGYEQVLFESGISEYLASILLALQEAVRANPIIMDWIEASDTAASAAAKESTQLLIRLFAPGESPLPEIKNDAVASATLP